MLVRGIHTRFVSFRIFKAMLRSSSSPNILIYSKDKARFDEVQCVLQEILEPHSYVIYPVDEDTLTSSQSWYGTTRLLILASDCQTSSKSVQAFLSNGGACLSFYPIELPELLRTEENGAALYKTQDGYLVSSTETSSLNLPHLLQRYFNLKIANNTSCQKKEHSFYTGYIVAEPFKEEAFFRHVRVEYSDSTMTYKLHLPSYSKQSAESIFVRRQQYGNIFNQKSFFSVLKTKSLGRTCLYFDTLSSTHALVDNNLSMPNGVVVVAKRQTVGRGRSGNVWLSPEGCAMFSFSIKFPLQCEMGRHLSLLQHLSALAVVSTVKEITKDLKIGVKWPNDIYYENQSQNTFEKLGGVLVTSSIIGHEVMAAVGIGVNLDNKRPTVCLNELITETGLKPVSLEHFIASVLNEMERLIDCVNAYHIHQVLDLYHSHWLHANAEVSVLEEEKSVAAHVMGIDRHGFLRVKLKNSGVVVTVHPDGNSFDMLNGLVVPKKQM